MEKRPCHRLLEVQLLLPLLPLLPLQRLLNNPKKKKGRMLSRLLLLGVRRERGRNFLIRKMPTLKGGEEGEEKEEEEEEEEDPTPEEAQLYETPSEYSEALAAELDGLVGVAKFTLFDPCAGNGAISDVMEKRGHTAIKRDLYTMNPPIDFLINEAPTEDYDIIIMNPPFKRIQEFLARAIAIGKPFAQLMLLDSFAAVGTKTKLSALPGVNILVLSSVKPFLHNGKKVNMRPCVWVMCIPGRTTGKFSFA